MKREGTDSKRRQESTSFLEKTSKKLLSISLRYRNAMCRCRPTQTVKSFLVLLFKKELFFFRLPSDRPAAYEPTRKSFVSEEKRQEIFVAFRTFRAQPGAILLLATSVALLSPAAQAHLVPGEAVGFLSGLKHPVSGLDHIIAMVSVGLWGAQLGAPAIWLLPVTFPLIMAVGGFLGLIGVPLPGTEIGIALSGVLLGAAVLLEWRPRFYYAAALVGLFGLYHGHAHGAELPPGQDALLYSLGFVLATGFLHLTGITIGLIHRWPWGERVLRVAGGAVSACGLYFLWTAVA